jgi:hypothetical protein
MKYKDFFKHLNESIEKPWDSSKLKSHLIKNRVYNYSGTLYHGTPYDGLLSILKNGIWGTEHGELSERETLSTSPNENVIRLFSESNDGTGLCLRVKNKKILVLDDILAHLATRESGSGIEFDFDENEYDLFCDEYDIPSDNRDHYLPYNFFSSIGSIDAITYEYTWKLIQRGKNFSNSNDESEICFIGNPSLDKLNKDISEIYIDYDPYDISEKSEAIKRLETE